MTGSRESGILCPVSSLPSDHGIGDFGPAAVEFIDFLAQARQRIWQILPLNPAGADGSPYYADSSFAGNRLLISPDLLAEDGLITKAECQAARQPIGPVQYARAGAIRDKLMDSVVKRLPAAGFRDDLETFIQEESGWLFDYALFRVLKEDHGNAPWTAWDPALRDRDPDALSGAASRNAARIHTIWVEQWLFMRQWEALRSHASSHGIELFGDLPIYTSHDSADVWAHPHLFELNARGLPSEVAGVPPDYFSSTGQRWGNPLYRWDQHEEEGFTWWLSRIGRALSLYDRLRIDHFRGLAAFWAIPAAYRTARKGRWVEGPGEILLSAIDRHFPDACLVAEDLGVIDDSVTDLMQKAGIPGMRVLQFAFSGDAENPHLPHNHPQNAYIYTGTHDNPPARGWFLDDATRRERTCLRRYLGREVSADDIADVLLRMAFSSVARHAVVPVWDLLNCGSEARMNRPGTEAGNWRWRLPAGWCTIGITSSLCQATETYGRAR